MESAGCIAVRFWGDLACFTRPEFKTERVTYPTATPSAARGMLEAIFWRPHVQWRIREIRLLKPPRFAEFVRNEVRTKASSQIGRAPFLADEQRTQRHTLALKDVDVAVIAELRVDTAVADPDAAWHQCIRRVERGQNFQVPYLGCREFLADFEGFDVRQASVDVDERVGPMLFDMRWHEHGAAPTFFEASIERGVRTVPQRLYEGISRDAIA